VCEQEEVMTKPDDAKMTIRMPREMYEEIRSTGNAAFRTINGEVLRLLSAALMAEKRLPTHGAKEAD
jgi:hypothetical protein